MPDRPETVRVEISPGELIDKITILEIKEQRIVDGAKRQNVAAELATLCGARDRAVPASDALARLAEELRRVNATLWETEDAVRDCERRADFGPRFVELARSIYQDNDRRAAVKRQINELMGSRLIEEKSYEPYGD
ncbi:unnamed protein product [marine sediment metagenome]|uniref:Uncharacterized protein n=1 Tax=marine sediment metagenome TaxID=412755 RepID=X0WJF4_9ZZZZ